ncbi:MAG: sporulation initiation factor Spo0A C-terminal domain-containing protein [Ruminococcus sp.]|nr:sporulation initiation factor Spo0A C-terminal domain-containing protein [Ruminococcus sp.]
MNKQLSKNKDVLMQYISETLLYLGFTPKLKGFNYANEAIYIYLNSSIADYNFKEVLSSIAQKYSITAKSVNSAIKTSIESAWCGNELNIYHELFSCSYIKADYPPTNSEFVATMAETIKLILGKSGSELYNNINAKYY